MESSIDPLDMTNAGLQTKAVRMFDKAAIFAEKTYNDWHAPEIFSDGMRHEQRKYLVDIQETVKDCMVYGRGAFTAAKFLYSFFKGIMQTPFLGLQMDGRVERHFDTQSVKIFADLKAGLVSF